MAIPRPDDIVCYEVGSGGAPAWISSRRELGDDFTAIGMLSDRHVIAVDVRGEQFAIRGATRVGLVVLPSGRRLIIRSKISSLTLLEWLAYLGEFPRLTSWLPNAGVTVGDDWHQCLASLFLYALECATRRQCPNGLCGPGGGGTGDSRASHDYGVGTSSASFAASAANPAASDARHAVQHRVGTCGPGPAAFFFLLAQSRRDDRRRMARLRERWRRSAVTSMIRWLLSLRPSGLVPRVIARHCNWRG